MLEKVHIHSGSAIVKAVACCALISACAFAQPAQASSSAETAKLVALERMWNQAQVIRDATAVASMIGDKFINTEWDGEVSDRGKFLADFADPKFQPSLMNIQDVKVNLYATTAIVSGIYHTKGTYGAKPYEHFGRFTDTCAFQERNWLSLPHHPSLSTKQ